MVLSFTLSIRDKSATDFANLKTALNLPFVFCYRTLVDFANSLFHLSYLGSLRISTSF